MFFVKLTTLLFFLISALLALSHPGEAHHRNLEGDIEKRAFLEQSGRSYSSCSGSIQKRDMNDRLAARRAAEIASIRSSIATKRALGRRQGPSGAPAAPSGEAAGTADGSSPGSASVSFDSTGQKFLNTSHASNLTGITVNTTSSTIFDSPPDNSTCLLQPEATIGPYWVAGEYVRGDVTEDQAGIPLYINVQVVDVTSCSVVPDIYWEIWHCNASGVYSGVVASGNGNTDDTSNLNATFLRGLQPTDQDGVVSMQTIFPGHYTGRTTHLHVIAHANATVYSNGTIGSGASGDGTSTTQHIGQLFFDQTLLDAIGNISPYSENTQPVTSNDQDDILAGEAVEGASDPFFEYVYLTGDIADGVYAWATVGIDSTASYSTKAASYLTPEGGVASTDSGGGMAGMSVTGNESDVPSGDASTSASALNAAQSGTGASASVVIAAAGESSSSTSTNSASASRSLPALFLRSWGMGERVVAGIKRMI